MNSGHHDSQNWSYHWLILIEKSFTVKTRGHVCIPSCETFRSPLHEYVLYPFQYHWRNRNLKKSRFSHPRSCDKVKDASVCSRPTWNLWALQSSHADMRVTSYAKAPSYKHIVSEKKTHNRYLDLNIKTCFTPICLIWYRCLIECYCHLKVCFEGNLVASGMLSPKLPWPKCL